MDGRIGHLQYRYHVLGDQNAMAEVKQRLDHLVQTDMVKRWEAALDLNFADDQTVYVLRQLNLRLVVAAGETDTTIVKQWESHLTKAVIRATQEEDEDFQNLITFHNQADYVTHFVIDLVEGHAWDRWFYGAFADLQNLSVHEALLRVLDDNHTYLGLIMAYLYQHGVLDKVLRQLDAAALHNLWSSAGGKQQTTPAQIQPLLTLAFRIADALQWWINKQPDQYAVLEAYLAQNSPILDWLDSESLLQVMVFIFKHLIQQGLIRPSLPGNISFESRLTAVRRQYDWVDFDKLITEVMAIPPSTVLLTSDLPVRNMRVHASPRQYKLMEVLHETLQSASLHLDLSQADPVANAIRLLAVLLAQHPEWTDDSLVMPIVEHLVYVWSLATQVATVDLLPQRLEPLLQRIPSTVTRELTIRALRFVNSTGEMGWSVIRLMKEKTSLSSSIIKRSLPSTMTADITGISTQAPQATTISTACAGVFLLLRTILDVKLVALLPNSPDFAAGINAFLLTLGLYWAGREGLIGDRVDPGLVALAGIETPLDLNDLQAMRLDMDGAQKQVFQRNLLRLLVGQRMVSASSITVHKLTPDDQQTILIAGTDTPRLWPFNTLITEPSQEADVIAAWLDDWEAASGKRPILHTVPETTEMAHLLEMLEVLQSEELRVIDPSLTIMLIANTLLRAWARWLGQFASSSSGYLLENFIRRPGTIVITDQKVLVELTSRPLDVVLRMSGYLSDIESIPWLGNRRICFQIQEA